MRKIIRQVKIDGQWIAPNVPKQKPKRRKKRKPATDAKQPKKNPYFTKESRRKFYRSREWKIARYKALKRSHGRCLVCGRSPIDGAVLNVDHIKPLHKYPELALEPSNHQVLCGACNAGKWGWDETDWQKEQKEWAGLTPIK
jgi:5-methylcytosine-specific restriction protein A